MTHFVPIPPHNGYRTHRLKQLTVSMKDGTLDIGVFGMPAAAKLGAESSTTFTYAEVNSANPDLRVFFVRGLRAGDRIAVLNDAGTQKLTDWLPVKRVLADHWAARRAAGTLPRSAYMSNITLDPYGAEQRHTMVRENDWLREVDVTIAKIRNNPIGVLVLGRITWPVTISARVQSDDNADSAITFTPQASRNKTTPGDTADETLFHEFVHVLEDETSFPRFFHVQEKDYDYEDIISPPYSIFSYDGTDFLTITATNLYASLSRRPLRKDHTDSTPMPAHFAGNGAAFKAAATANLNSVKSRLPALYQSFANSPAPWNPFK